MIQLFPGKTITTVSYGQNANGYPVVVVATAEGDVITLAADGYNVDPEFKLTTLRPTPEAAHERSEEDEAALRRWIEGDPFPGVDDVRQLFTHKP